MIAVVLLLLFVAAQLLAGTLGILMSHPEALSGGIDMASLRPTPESMGLSMFVVESLLCLLFWLWYRRYGQPIESRPLTKSLSTSLVWAVGAAMLWGLGLSMISEPFDLPDLGNEAMFAEMVHHPVCLLLLCVVGPLTEELFFRVGILREMYRKGVSGWLAAIISAFAFAAVHGNLQQGIPALLIGVVLGLFYLRTGNLKLCLPAHIANNTLAVALLLIPGGSTFTEGWSVTLLLALGLILVSGGIACTWRALK